MADTRVVAAQTLFATLLVVWTIGGWWLYGTGKETLRWMQRVWMPAEVVLLVVVISFLVFG